MWETFLDTPASRTLEDSSVVIVPVPYDSTTSFKSGARHGPRAVITASKQLEEWDIELERDVSTVGIYTTQEIEPHTGWTGGDDRARPPRRRPTSSRKTSWRPCSAVSTP